MTADRTPFSGRGVGRRRCQYGLTANCASASGVATGRLHVWPRQSMATGAVGPRQVVARRAVGPQAPVEPQDGQRRIGRARARPRPAPWRPDRRAVRRSRCSRRAPACRRCEEQRAGCRRVLPRAPEKARIRPSAAVAPARLGGQMPQPGENLGEKADAGWGRPVVRVPRARAGNVGGVARRSGRRRPRRRRTGRAPRSRAASAASRSSGSPLASNSASAARAIAA